MSEQQLADYRAHPESYFGKLQIVGKNISDKFELFEWFVETHKELSRTTLLERLANTQTAELLNAKSDEDLMLDYCELLVASMPSPQTQC